MGLPSSSTYLTYRSDGRVTWTVRNFPLCFSTSFFAALGADRASRSSCSSALCSSMGNRYIVSPLGKRKDFTLTTVVFEDGTAASDARWKIRREVAIMIKRIRKNLSETKFLNL